jgi:hypothetical protein
MKFDNINVIENVMIITNEDGTVTCMPRQDCTPSEESMFKEFEETYPQGKPLRQDNTIIEADYIDQEKVAMAQAIIDLNNRIEQLESIIKGGVING